jgi:hypothetical protein
VSHLLDRLGAAETIALVTLPKGTHIARDIEGRIVNAALEQAVGIHQTQLPAGITLSFDYYPTWTRISARAIPGVVANGIRLRPNTLVYWDVERRGWQGVVDEPWVAYGRIVPAGSTVNVVGDWLRSVQFPDDALHEGTFAELCFRPDGTLECASVAADAEVQGRPVPRGWTVHYDGQGEVTVLQDWRDFEIDHDD